MTLRALISSTLPCLLCVLLFGCSREEVLTFDSSEAVKELDEEFQETIQTSLVKYYGTASEPTWTVHEWQEDDDGQRTVVAEEYLDSEWLKKGAASYQRRCAGCHGTAGDGLGEAAPYLNPKPRDYRRGIFKFTSTPYGARPRRQDLIRTIRRGAKGTSMPAFRWLSTEEIQPLVDYVIYLSYRGELELLLANDVAEFEELEEGIEESFAIQIHKKWQDADSKLVLPEVPPPVYSKETIAAGRQIFLSEECAKCHGTDGKGQTIWLSPKFIAEQESKPPSERISINRDSWGNVAPAADLTAGMLHGGRRPVDVYRRIYSGINGTPMPGFAVKFSGEDRVKIWYLTHFIISLTEGQELDEKKETASDESDTEEGSGSESSSSDDE